MKTINKWPDQIFIFTQNINSKTLDSISKDHTTLKPISLQNATSIGFHGVLLSPDNPNAVEEAKRFSIQFRTIRPKGKLFFLSPPHLLRSLRHFKNIDALVVSDLYFRDGNPRPTNEVLYDIYQLKSLQLKGVTILVLEHLSDPYQAQHATILCLQHSFSAYIVNKQGNPSPQYGGPHHHGIDKTAINMKGPRFYRSISPIGVFRVEEELEYSSEEYEYDRDVAGVETQFTSKNYSEWKLSSSLRYGFSNKQDAGIRFPIVKSTFEYPESDPHASQTKNEEGIGNLDLLYGRVFDISDTENTLTLDIALSLPTDTRAAPTGEGSGLNIRATYEIERGTIGYTMGPSIDLYGDNRFGGLGAEFSGSFGLGLEEIFGIYPSIEFNLGTEGLGAEVGLEYSPYSNNFYNIFFARSSTSTSAGLGFQHNFL